MEDLKFDVGEKYLHFKQIFHHLSNKITGKQSPFEHFTELNFNRVRIRAHRFLNRLSCSAFNDLKDADVFILRFDHEVIFGNGSERFDVGNGKGLVNVSQGFVYTGNEGKDIKFHFVTADDKLLAS